MKHNRIVTTINTDIPDPESAPQQPALTGTTIFGIALIVIVAAVGFLIGSDSFEAGSPQEAPAPAETATMIETESAPATEMTAAPTPEQMGASPTIPPTESSTVSPASTFTPLPTLTQPVASATPSIAGPTPPEPTSTFVPAPVSDDMLCYMAPVDTPNADRNIYNTPSKMSNTALGILEIGEFI